MNENNSLPLVSCLCVTKNELPILTKAIDCFNAQTYPNKELIILKQNHDPVVIQALQNLNASNIFFIDATNLQELTLGELRNLSIEKSNGEFFCVWDDDDWYHADRLRIQVDAAITSQHPVTALTNELVFDKSSNRVFFSLIRLWENSILCRRSLFDDGIRYPPLPRGEDAHFLKQLLSKSRVFPVISANLYIYVFHGGNTSVASNFHNFFAIGQELSEKSAQVVVDILNGKYTAEEASRVMDASSIPKEVNYFHLDKKSIKSFGAQKEAANIEIMRMKMRTIQ
jgi:glycosyltransferase involved in cell wall biosynthesis